MTPRAYYALLDRYRRNQRHDLYCAAIPACAIYNVNRKDENVALITPEDLIGGDTEPAPQQRQSGSDMLLVVKHLLNPMFNGTDNTNPNV